MSHITKLSIKNYRGIKEFSHDFQNERFIVLIGRGDSGKSTILSAINAVLSPSWNMTFSDLDFHNQDTTQAIEITININELPTELLKESKYGLFLQNDLNEDVEQSDLFLTIQLTVDSTLEPHWVVKSRISSGLEDKHISGSDRALLAVNYISDYTDNQFAYNRQSPLYALTKLKLEDANTIEHVKSQLIRTLADSVKGDQLDKLNKPLNELANTAYQIGLDVDNLSAQIDIKENPYTGNSISLHNGDLPFRVKGKGSKRLMSIAIQSELTKQGGIILVDELEQGLEPDRITLLVRQLKSLSSGQVFITTHNANVISESNCHNLHIKTKGSSELRIVGQELFACHRYNPQVFFSKRIILCEGDTEDGFMRSIDNWLWANHNKSFSSYGIVWANAGGGSNMFDYALNLKKLGFDTCVFADDDKPNELADKKQQCKNEKIPLYLCESGKCIEEQIMEELSICGLRKVIQCTQEGFPKIRVIPSQKFEDKINSLEKHPENEQDLRKEIAESSTTGKWFKHIQGGEFLGAIVMEDWEQNNGFMQKTIINLLRWCSIEL
jgi:AAA15 family ATPase/GTPase